MRLRKLTKTHGTQFYTEKIGKMLKYISNQNGWDTKL